MYSKALFLTALLCDLSLAGYNIKMYEKASCSGVIGHRCNNIKERVCCGSSSAMQSAEFDEAQGDCDDKIKIYKHSGCGDMAQAEANNPKCDSATEKTFHEAQIAIVINARKRGLSGAGGIVEREEQPRGSVQPDESFYQNGTNRSTRNQA
jgi:hypothetical protein